MKKAVLFIAGFGILAGAVYWYIKVQAALLKDFSYKIIGFRVQNISKTNLSFTLKFLFVNQSSIEAKVTNIYSDVFLEGKNVGFITESKEFIIPEKGSTEIELYFSLQLSGVILNLPNILEAILLKKNLQFSLKGTATVKSGFITKTLPIEYNSTVI